MSQLLSLSEKQSLHSLLQQSDVFCFRMNDTGQKICVGRMDYLAMNVLFESATLIYYQRQPWDDQV